MKSLTLIALIVSLNSWAAISPGVLPDGGPETRDPGLLKGYAALSREFAYRVMDDSSQSFSFIKYINNDPSLAELLGTTKTVNGSSVRVNSSPGPVSMVLYNAVFSAFALEMTGTCDPKTQGRLRGGFKLSYFTQVIWKDFCEWQDLSEQNPTKADQVLDAVYDLIIGYEAPEEERTLWKKWVWAELKGKTTVLALPPAVHALLMNPYFILEN